MVSPVRWSETLSELCEIFPGAKLPGDSWEIPLHGPVDAAADKQEEGHAALSSGVLLPGERSIPALPSGMFSGGRCPTRE